MKLSQPIYINDVTVLITCANSTSQADLIATNLWCCWEEVWQVLSELTFRPCKTMMGFLIWRILWYVVRIWRLMPECVPFNDKKTLAKIWTKQGKRKKEAKYQASNNRSLFFWMQRDWLKPSYTCYQRRLDQPTLVHFFRWFYQGVLCILIANSGKAQHFLGFEESYTSAKKTNTLH